jgi:restriction endonuclease Mrr
MFRIISSIYSKIVEIYGEFIDTTELGQMKAERTREQEIKEKKRKNNIDFADREKQKKSRIEKRKQERQSRIEELAWELERDKQNKIKKQEERLARIWLSEVLKRIGQDRSYKYFHDYGPNKLWCESCTIVQDKHSTKSYSSISQVMKGLSSLTPIEFEEIVKTVFENLGYTDVSTTPGSHDGGIDIIGYKDSHNGSKKMIAQCKRVDLVGVKVARELLGVVAADQSIAEAFLVTSGTVSQKCKTFCGRNGSLSVIEGAALVAYIVQFGIPLRT